MIKALDVGNSSQCSDGSAIVDMTSQLTQIKACLATSNFASCKDVLDQCGPVASGWYTIQSMAMFCDMDGSNCDDKGGWTRVAFVNASDNSTNCPGDWDTEVTGGKRVCIDRAASCESAYFPTNGVSYSEVCGSVVGYQFGTLDAFGPQRYTPDGIDIDGIYLDGVSVTYGSSPRKHVWSLTGGITEVGDTLSYCPCNVNSRSLVPAFVKDFYYCESGRHAGGAPYQLFPDDPLWDGKNCGGLEEGCCINPKMPWWYRDLAETTSDDIEVRLCNNSANDEAAVLETMEIYVR